MNIYSILLGLYFAAPSCLAQDGAQDLASSDKLADGNASIDTQKNMEAKLDHFVEKLGLMSGFINQQNYSQAADAVGDLNEALFEEKMLDQDMGGYSILFLIFEMGWKVPWWIESRQKIQDIGMGENIGSKETVVWRGKLEDKSWLVFL